jgi:ATPase subunit of ABC transporter with duplicated ATPase domains
MLTVDNLRFQYSKKPLFDEVNLQFNKGNCYGVIGANGAGKSTFMKLLSGDLDPTTGSISLEPGKRMAVLSQNHNAFEEYTVLDTVMMGYKKLYDISVEKNAIYMNPDATEAESIRAGELENEYGEMGGWTAESDAAGLLSNMGIKEQFHHKTMSELDGSQKVKVLLAQALFGDPDLLLLDEPTNDLDPRTVQWLSDFLAGFKNTVIVISHDRYFLDMVCTHIVDIDFTRIKSYTGNYSFWYQSSQLMAQQVANKNKKNEQKRKEMMEFIQRFSANASKSKQATSRKKALDKLDITEIKPSTRKYPFINFKPEREVGDQILRVDGLSAKNEDGDILFNDVSFIMNKGEKIALLGADSNAVTTFYQMLAGERDLGGGKVEWGQTISWQYLPSNNDEFFTAENDLELVDWLRQFSEEKEEQFIRGFLGRMFFAGDDIYKKSSVLSGGEKVRCMLSKIMLAHPNFLLLNEPTGHLDLESITALNNSVKDFPGNLIMSSHDHELIASTVNRIIELTPNGIIDQLMDYNEYVKSPKVEKLREELYGAAV